MYQYEKGAKLIRNISILVSYPCFSLSVRVDKYQMSSSEVEGSSCWFSAVESV